MGHRSRAGDGPTQRILIALQPTHGGVARHVSCASEELAKRGWDVTVAAPREHRFSNGIASEAVKYIELPMVREINPAKDLRSFIRLVRLCRNLRPDILHVESSKAGFLGRVGRGVAAVPVVVFSPRSWSFEAVEGRRRDLYVRLERFASRFCDMTVAISQSEIDVALANRVLRPQAIRLINNGVPPSKPLPLPEHVRKVVDGKDQLIVSVGRLAEQKGYCYLVDAMAEVVAKVPSACLVVAGDGPYRNDLEAQARGLGISENVHFVGDLEDVKSLLDRACLFVLSALWDSLPHAILEAMDAGLAAVVTDVGGCGELVQDGKTGLLVPARNPTAMAEAIVELLTNPHCRARMAEMALARARDVYALDKCIDKHEALYFELLERKQATKSPSRNAAVSQS